MCHLYSHVVITASSTSSTVPSLEPVHQQGNNNIATYYTYHT